MMKAVYKGHKIAESDECIFLEGNYYFPNEAVDHSYLKKSDRHTTCLWKGEASYYHLVVDDEVIENAAWYYPNPDEKAYRIKNFIAFYDIVEVIEE